ncbi:hypothetical protein ACFW04_006546 [Cataglyphis niger]
MSEYRKTIVGHLERKRKINQDLESDALKKIGKKTAKQVTFKKEAVIRKKNKEENNIIDMDENKNIKNVKKLVKVQGSLLLEGKDTSKKKMLQIRKENSFTISHRGDMFITAKLNPNKCSTKGGRNFLRIIDKVLETKIKPIKIVKSDFNAVDLYYDNIIKANKCLDFYKGIPREEQVGNIMERFTRRKRVISDWDFNIVVTFKRNELPVQLSLFDGLTSKRVISYISVVK